MYYLLLILFLLIKLINNQELFTSSAELQQLINIENKIPKIIENYIILENERLENLKRIILIKYQNNNNNNNNELFQLNSNNILNPLNALNLIKKLTKIWKEIKKEIKSDLAENYLKNISNKRETRFPTEDDLNGAIQGLLRLQDTYKLKTKDLANGILLNNINIKKQMNVKDCYEIGMNAFNEKDYYHSLLWIQEAYERNLYEESPEIDGPNESEILNILSISLYKQGNLKRALEINNKLIKIDPYYPNAINNSKLYEQELKNNGIFEEDFYKNIPLLNNPRWLNETILDKNYLKYEELCRGEVNLDILEISKLYCYYKMDNSFLRLAPIKVEIIHFEPLAVIFRNVISDNEIEILKNLSISNLSNSKVQDPITGKGKEVKYRISKNAWLNKKSHPFIIQLAKRMGLMTNLNMRSAEALQMGNYGIGGHYEPHYDFATERDENSTSGHHKMGLGNRISTVLFYLSTPENGGYTVFNEINIYTKATKNDAVFWYNLLRSGKGDLRTKHAACPVLIGEKWVSNSWIHERGQEFIRPCALSPLINERYVGDLGGPEPKKYPNISPYCKEGLYC